MSSLKGSKTGSKYKDSKNNSGKESNTLDNKHRLMVKHFSQQRNDKQSILSQIKAINLEIATLDERRDTFTPEDIKHRALLLDKKDELDFQYKSISSNFDEMDYYDRTGDLIIQYYELRDGEVETKQAKNILFFLILDLDQLHIH